MTQIAKTVARGLASRLGRALTRSVAHRYAEQRLQVERTASAGCSEPPPPSAGSAAAT